ncbi:MAG: hypothetical protein GF313_09290 [Caldithrix sp.]|nr:hypothetical protein [Caldithrix sp.]
MTNSALDCKKAHILMMGRIDDELDDGQNRLLDEHLKSCNACQQQWNTFVHLKERTGNMAFKSLPDMYWDDYWQKVYNRIERGISWIFVSVGAIILIVYGFYESLSQFFNDPTVPIIIKLGIGILGVGFIILFVSIVREKLMVRKVDKYRSVKR